MLTREKLQNNKKNTKTATIIREKAKQHSAGMCTEQHTCNHADTCERHVRHRWELDTLKGIMNGRDG